MSKRNIVLDTDVGIDDAIMVLQLAAEPDAEIVAVGSTHGNCSAHQAAINTIKVLDVAGLNDVPVAIGLENPDTTRKHSAHVHGHDGLADVGIPAPSRQPTDEGAVEQIIRLSHERPGELDLVAVGAFTNIAAALERDPDVLERYRSFWILGGLSRRPQPGDHESFDANIFHNAAASAQMFAGKTQVTVIPIDLSYRMTLSDEHLDRIKTGTTPVAQFVWKILPYYCNFYEQRLGRWSASMHDSTVTAALLDPSLIQEEVERRMIVEPTKDRYHAVGLTEDDPEYTPDGKRERIITEIDQDRYLDRLVDGFVQPLGTLAPIGA